MRAKKGIYHVSYSRSANVLTSKQEEYYKKELILRDYIEREGDTPGSSILDSSLISQSKLKKYTIKVVECGDYKSVYFYETDKYTRKTKESFDDLDLIHKLNYFKIDSWFEKTKEKKSREVQYKEIELKNINRSRIEMQRLVKSNIDDFKTFITLTFDSNKNDIDINDINSANKVFNVWRRNIKRKKQDFKYIAVPEFQKRGAIHYHLLSNIDYNDVSLLSQEEVRLWNKKSKSWQVGKNIFGWNYGFSLVKDMQDINIVGYLSKYMTKEIDNRLFSRHRYMYSQNLKKPIETYIDLSDKKELLYYLKSLNNKQVVYRNTYKDKFGNDILFLEYRS